MDVVFYLGLHQPADAANFQRACISINRVRGRRKPVDCPDVLLDSGAFTELHNHGAYRHEPAEYAAEVKRLHALGVLRISAAVAQDYMCEPFMLERTGMPLLRHQELTIQRYDALVSEDLPVPVMPVLQGYTPADYARHVHDYGSRLLPGMWVGVGSVCKRQGDPRAIVRVLSAIRAVRPDLRLHGFGVKYTSLMHPGVREMLATADSMAWSYAARREGRSANDWREAKAFAARIDGARPGKTYQMELGL
ncbi:MAG: hypothetical protein GYB50_03810 [Rhodobacteraceae bacterium]|nr:hypothetical protein [Paracoccaceae bacterium]